jgi:chromatin structure-remodeling complex subunit RSC1/2
VRDVCQIFHNAQIYNRPSAPVFSWALELRKKFEDKLKELVADGTITAEEAELPDLGEIPETEDSPMQDGEDEEAEEDEEDEEDEDEDDDSEEEGDRRRSRRRGRTSTKRERDDGAKDDDAPKRRGRPPKVLTPMEGRIHAVLFQLRKFKGDDGEARILPFEKLPDKATNPDYYQAIKQPIALDNIKKKAKRKKYRNVDEMLQDLERMFENAMAYNEEGSEIYDHATELQKQARILAEQEKAKSDSAFRDEDGKQPLSEIQYNGQIWKVGKLLLPSTV